MGMVLYTSDCYTHITHTHTHTIHIPMQAQIYTRMHAHTTHTCTCIYHSHNWLHTHTHHTCTHVHTAYIHTHTLVFTTDRTGCIYTHTPNTIVVMASHMTSIYRLSADRVKPCKAEAMQGPHWRSAHQRDTNHCAIWKILLLNAVEVFSVLLDTSSEEFLQQMHTMFQVNKRKPKLRNK